MHCSENNQTLENYFNVPGILMHYIMSLCFAHQKYMIPMKSQEVFDNNVVDTIFYKINEIYMHHATFLAFLERALASWSLSTTIGDVIYKTVSNTLKSASFVLKYMCMVSTVEN